MMEPAARVYRSVYPSKNLVLAESCDYLFQIVEGGELRVRLPELGIFEVSGRSDILKTLLVNRMHDPAVADAVRKYVNPSKDAVDIGANIGLFTILLASMVSEANRVLAVEPAPGALVHLKKNIEMNGYASKVIIYEGVAAEIGGMFTLHVVEGMEEYSSLLHPAHPAIKSKKEQGVQVAGETVDHLVERFALTPGIIKIDTEATELQVLRGAENTIVTHRPVILSELAGNLLSAAGASADTMIRFLTARGYAIDCRESGNIVAIPT
jgi:FkbM family methyltransferase